MSLLTEEDIKREELRVIASLTDNLGWQKTIEELDRKVQSLQRNVHDAQSESEEKLLSATRTWLAMREARRIVAEFPRAIRQQLEQEGDPLYGFRKLDG